MTGTAMTNASRFRTAHEADWARLDALVGRMEKRSVRALADDDLLALPLLYRTALSSLATARVVSLDRALVAYLERLCLRAYFQLYGPPGSIGMQLMRFLGRDWPDAVRALWRETLAMLLLTVAAAMAGYLLVRADPAWFYALVPDAMTQGRDPTASAAALRATLHGGERGMLGAFATFLFTHNAQIAIFSFALGIAFAVPTVLLIAFNGLTLGAMLELFVAKGVGPEFGAWLAIHGTTELFAIILAGAAGAHIGLALAFPGRLARGDAAVAAGRRGALAMIGTVAMLAVAGLLEGVGRQTVGGTAARALVGGAMLACWLLYFYVPRRHRAGR